MSEINIDTSAIKNVLKCLDSTNQNIKSAIKELNDSLFSINEPIKSKIGSSYINCQLSLNKINVNCAYTVTGMTLNAQSYMNYENSAIGSDNTENIPLGDEKLFYTWDENIKNTSTGENQVKADLSFFQNLVASGKGNIKDGIYYCSGFSYNPSKGELIYKGSNGKDRVTYCGIYYPKNAINLKDLNVTTVILGDNGRKKGFSQYVLDRDNEQSSFNNTFGKVDISSVLVVVQSSNDGNNAYTSNGFDDNIVHCTDFTNMIAGENNDRSNAIVGYSSGGFSALNISATTGKDRYDTVVVLNSYLKATGVRSDNPNSGDVLTQISDLNNLKNKEIIFIEAASDGKNNELNVKGLPILKKAGCENVTFLTPNEKVISVSKECGYNTYKIDDSYKWNGHASVGKLIRDSNIMDYLGSK